MRSVSIERTENPKVVKFVTDYTIIPGAVELDRSSDISEIPLAQEVFNFPFVEKIFVTANFVAIAKSDSVKWEDVEISLRNVIEDELLAHPRLYTQKKKELYQIYAEMTPNPSVMKFVSNRLLLEGFLEVTSPKESSNIPVAKAIFDEFPYIQQVFISDNYLSLTKDDTYQWHEIMTNIRAFIAEYLQNGGVVSEVPGHAHENPAEKLINREYTDTEEKINAILTEYVAPSVENDGGKISLIEYIEETKTARMLLQGACSGCPSSTMTLKSGIQAVLRNFLPDVVEEVEAVNG